MGIIFDLDGTLFDSLEDLKNSLNIVLKRHGLPQHSSADYQNYIGSGMKVLVDRAVPEDYLEKELILEEFLVEYGNRYYEYSRPYEGVVELLIELNKRDIPIAICTNKRQDYTDDIIKRFFSEVDLVDVVGDRLDGLTKPNATYTKEIAKKMNIDPSEILFVGDSDIDMQTSLNANMQGIGVSWGFRSVEELKAAGAKAIINSPEDIFKLI